MITEINFRVHPGPDVYSYGTGKVLFFFKRGGEEEEKRRRGEGREGRSYPISNTHTNNLADARTCTYTHTHT